MSLLFDPCNGQIGAQEAMRRHSKWSGRNIFSNEKLFRACASTCNSDSASARADTPMLRALHWSSSLGSPQHAAMRLGSKGTKTRLSLWVVPKSLCRKYFKGHLPVFKTFWYNTRYNQKWVPWADASGIWPSYHLYTTCLPFIIVSFICLMSTFMKNLELKWSLLHASLCKVVWQTPNPLGQWWIWLLCLLPRKLQELCETDERYDKRTQTVHRKECTTMIQTYKYNNQFVEL